MMSDFSHHKEKCHDLSEIIDYKTVMRMRETLNAEYDVGAP